MATAPCWRRRRRNNPARRCPARPAAGRDGAWPRRPALDRPFRLGPAHLPHRPMSPLDTRMHATVRRFLASSALAAACLVSTSAFAGARDDLKAFTTGLKGLDGQFNQQVFDSRGKVKETTSGRVALSAPRLFRWEYQKPHVQLIVADGSKVWMHEPDLDQATVRAQGKEEQNSPLTALINPALLDQQYD